MASRRSRHSPQEIAYYEGLVFKTASIWVRYVEEDFEDIQQLIRLKVWRALQSYDSTRSSQPVERYVFTCVVNLGKDLAKRKRRHETYIEDNGRWDDGVNWGFHERYLAVPEDTAYAELEPDVPVIPDGVHLTGRQRELLDLLYAGYSPRECERALKWPRREVQTILNELQAKLARSLPLKVAA